VHTSEDFFLKYGRDISLVLSLESRSISLDRSAWMSRISSMGILRVFPSPPDHAGTALESFFMRFSPSREIVRKYEIHLVQRTRVGEGDLFIHFVPVVRSVNSMCLLSSTTGDGVV